ncbi:MAG: PolC-type DNA polymerase III, partial [Clostridium sp.]|nr:PolC-type DNA polymerase III [Clostridium sp.]
MSKKIPFLQMFAALHHWTELAQAVEGWLILSASIDKTSRSASLVVEGADGAGANLLREAEETICRAYSLSSVKIQTAIPEPATPPASPEKQPQEPLRQPSPAEEAAPAEQDAFSRAEAIRAAAMKRVSRPAEPKGEGKPAGKTIFGKTIKKTATPIGELELDMGMV